jgi:hypothetical protein
LPKRGKSSTTRKNKKARTAAQRKSTLEERDSFDIASVVAGDLNRDLKPPVEDIKKLQRTRHRLNKIYAGRHPDTDQPLRFGDEYTLELSEQLDARDAIIKNLLSPIPDATSSFKQWVASQVSLWEARGKKARLLAIQGVANEFRADLERATPPKSVRAPADENDVDTIEELRHRGEAVLAELRLTFDRTQNPVFVWQALRLATGLGINIPYWVLDYLAAAAGALASLYAKAKAKKALGREAELVGKALGFGTRGRGRTGMFEAAARLRGIAK